MTEILLRAAVMDALAALEPHLWDCIKAAAEKAAPDAQDGRRKRKRNRWKGRR
jgi:hypothetical protein